MERTVKFLSRVMLVVVVMIGAGRSEATLAYQTGFIDGTVLTSAGAAVPNTQVNAIALDTNGYVTTAVQSDGTFHFEVPTGNYRIEARYEGSYLIGSLNVTVANQTSSPASFTLYGGHLRTAVTQDQQPAAGAFANIQETPPSSCAIADPGSCSSIDPGGTYCYSCTANGQQFSCWSAGQCYWSNPASFSAYADSNGLIDQLVPIDAYTISVYSPWQASQWGQFRVGQMNATMTDGAIVDTDPVSYSTGYLTGAVTRNGQPYTTVMITASNDLGSAQASAWNATYMFRLPLGTYDLVATDQSNNTQFGKASATLAEAGATVTQDFALVVPTATVQGRVLEDGTPESGAWVRIQQAPPSSCAVADTGSCSYSDPNGSYCYSCTANGQQFSCWSPGQCYWWNPLYYNAYTDGSTGAYTFTIVPGSYTIDTYTAWMAGQWGQFQVQHDTLTVAAGDVIDRGDTTYQTGEIAGTITNCTSPDTNVYVTASSSYGSAQTYSWNQGNYTLRVPVGSYSVTAQWSSLTFGSATVDVAAGTTTPFSANGNDGAVEGQILSNGQPAVGSFASIHEIPPSSCALATSCSYADPSGAYCYSCQTASGRYFTCWSAGQCYWWNSQGYSAYTGADGTFRTEVGAGDFMVDAYSGFVAGQQGSVEVGSVEALVNACSLAEVGAGGNLVEPGTNVIAQLNDGVTLTFSDVTSGGEVSYVATSTQQGGPPPANFRFDGLYYDFTIGATFSGSVTVCLPYDPTQTRNPNSLSIFHYVNNTWTQLASTVNTTTDVVCAQTTSFSWYVVGELLDAPPVANAGADFEVAVDDNCIAAAPLDGSNSYDPDGTAIASYAWSLADGTSLGTGANVTAQLKPGTYNITLVVTDVVGFTSSDVVQVRVVDKTPPKLQMTLSPSVLWPPDNKMYAITPTVSATDNCTASPTVQLEYVTSPTAPAKDIDTSNGISLRAARNGTEVTGRTYDVAYRAIDGAGNATTATATVTVPHDQGQ